MAFNQQENSMGGSEPIALIGVGCKLPGNITTTQGLLTALREGRDLVSDVPPDRWNVEAFYDPDPLVPGKTYVRKGGFVEDIYQFDAGFFGISDSEAARMDPQQRMVLQAVWHALEDAGQSADELMNSNTGVFLAMMNTNGYSHLKGVFEGPRGINAYDAMGDAMSISAGRISHFLGLEGPCLTLDTACSSSLVALHLARQSILMGECDMAIVAGVNAILHPAVHIAFSKVGLMSRAGRCATFDASADGYIRGEGCVAVILRRESQAVAKGDRILASIVGTAVNQDGRTPALTAPNGRSQEKVMRSALARVGISPNEIGYVEAHGTGTLIGDPIEMSAIVNVYGPGRSENQTLYVGSVKSNFGHIEAGAGLLGLVKAALSLSHEEILPSIHFTKLNPDIDLSHAPVRIPTEKVAWPRTESPRLAGINSFGYSGTNAHVILQEAPAASNGHAPKAQERSLMERENRMVVVSAKSNAALDDLVDQWIGFLNQETTLPLSNLAFTAALGRTHLSHRLAIIGNSTDEIKQKLQNWREGRAPKGFASGQVLFKIKPRIAFMFTGQGAQYAEMGRELYQTEPRFAESINKVAAVMDADLGAPLTEVMFGEKSAEYLENTRYVQPALFAIEYALAELLRYWGVEPSYVIGHSVGELVAACVSGVLDLEDAARFVVARGRLMGALPEGGKMLAISASVEQIQKWIIGREAEIAIATVNGPRSVVVSGSAEAIAAINEIAQGAGRQTKELEVSHAFHSPLMDPILDELTQVAASMRTHPARIPIASNTTGDFYKEEPKPEYWSQHVRQAVLFHAGMEKIIDAGCSLVIEIGPHPALTPAVVTAFDSPSLQTVPTLRRDKNDVFNLLGSLASLYVNGAPLKFERLLLGTDYHSVPLPLYPFRPDRYSLNLESVVDLPPDAFPLMESASNSTEDEADFPELPATLHPLLGQVVTHTARKAVFEVAFKTASPWTDHRVLETTVFPGTGYIEMAARGFAATTGQDSCPVILREVIFERPLLLSFREEKKVRLTLEHPANSKASTKFTISTADDTGAVYCRGRIATLPEKQAPVKLEDEFNSRETVVKIGSFYGELRTRGLEYGARFANVRELWQGKAGSGEAIGRVTDTSIAAQNNNDPYKNAILLDGCLHVFGAALNMLDEVNNQAGAFVPATIQSVTINGDLPAQVWSHVRVTTSGDKRGALANVRVLNDAGDPLVEFINLELRHTLTMSFGKKVNSATSSTANKFFKSRENLIEILRPMTRKERVSLLSKWMTAEIVDTMGQAAAGLNLEKLPPSTAFLEIGLDSLLVTELQRRIQERLEFRFKPMQGLDYQSIESLAGYIHDEVLAADLTPAVSEPANETQVSEAAAD